MKCADCKLKKGKYCDYVEWDDEDYPHNNSEGVGIEAYALDDSGMEVQLRVDDDFGCVKFVDRNGGRDE